jgi:hypothetical protein
MEILMKPQLQNKKSDAQTKREENSWLAPTHANLLRACLRASIMRKKAAVANGARGAGVRVFLFAFRAHARWGLWGSQANNSVRSRDTMYMHTLGRASKAGSWNMVRQDKIKMYTRERNSTLWDKKSDWLFSDKNLFSGKHHKQLKIPLTSISWYF